MSLGWILHDQKLCDLYRSLRTVSLVKCRISQAVYVGGLETIAQETV